MDIRQAIRNALGGGSDINAANPLPVDISPGVKTATTVVDEATIALSITTGFADCTVIDLTGGPGTLALTIKARYNAAAALGIRIHVRTSPTDDATGVHTAVANALVMTDANAHFVLNELVGLTIENVTDSSSGVVTANTETTVTVAALAGGTTDQWNTNDVYSVDGADYDTADWDVWDAAFVADAVLRQTHHYDTGPMYVKVLVENLDAGVAVTDVEVIASVGG
ncbi:hypothetical protein LCGC14_1297160 [marine sediment metagenome]|uniref:Uncharacterized protein n=1 Tax=marine sediment metagenome TaxID=412755 RepID=A0A0F9KSC6_9ZZZZ